MTDSAREKSTIVLIPLVSAAVGSAIFAYGVAVRDVCLGAGLGPAVANLLALLACTPILAALYSIDT
jgi:hypothetical protein